ncbi:putative non-specific serine/threonine protein kinase [Helianthus annuus]|nr:putative non-specific serine/threonine protein kinase [Helianthus annuus]
MFIHTKVYIKKYTLILFEKIKSKLGWGHFSTVWLAWDTQKSDHLALMMELLGMMPRKKIIIKTF